MWNMSSWLTETGGPWPGVGLTGDVGPGDGDPDIAIWLTLGREPPYLEQITG